ncbi:GntR family transcriptional regulator [Nonomuraea lactucae]|uniref:GntR family transcriptional regulator n=1 Tax=Nonomuraea lactucae TaxID=2249762 RepID=UPI000DE3CD8F|nr:GntR family transcriptional regulator [Nonomuraea lactucae]
MPAPRYQEVADDLRTKIRNGTYKIGEPLPHARDLMTKYGLGSQSVLNKVYAILKAEQLIRRNAAVGMIVQDPRPIMVDLILHGQHGHGPLPWAQCCERTGVEGQMITDKVRQEPVTAVSADVAELLDLSDGDEVAIRTRHATIGDTTVRLDEAIYPLSLVRDTPIAEPGQVKGGVYNALAGAGMEPATITRRVISTRPATEAEAKAMKLAPRAHVLTYDQVIADSRRRLVELLRFVANPARVRFVDEQMQL